MNLNKVQLSAYNMIQSDARFLYTLTDIQKNTKNIDSNYIMMCQPYIGIFADGSEQWAKKVGLKAPAFNVAEKSYYTVLRQGHKLLDVSYKEYETKLLRHLDISDHYFYSIRSIRERLLGYYNVGTDILNGEFCGNTVICAMNTPIATLQSKNAGMTIKELSVIAGKLAAFYGCKDFSFYRYDDAMAVRYKDYHFYKNCPLKLKSNLGFVLFSILCNINYVIEFIEYYFTEDIPQKFKFAYLQYYYLCDFIDEINFTNNMHLTMDIGLKNRKFRNCLVHYGLGQYLSENDIMEQDPLKGLTNKAFNMDYFVTKEMIFAHLKNLVEQIKKIILC